LLHIDHFQTSDVLTVFEISLTLHQLKRVVHVVQPVVFAVCSFIVHSLHLLGVVVPPAIPYIFKIVGDSLHLCGPADGAMKRPKSFEGPGLCIMERVTWVRFVDFFMEFQILL